MNIAILIMAFIALIILIKGIIGDTSVRQTPGLFLELTIDHIKIKGTINMVQLTSTQQVSGTLEPTNRLGAPAPVETGTVLVESSDTTVVVVERDPEDEKKFKLKAKGPGVAQINFVADADLGEGVATITGFVGVEVVPAQAAGFGVSLGTPEEQPA